MPRSLPPAISELETRLGLPAESLDGPDLDRAKAALSDATTLVLAEVAGSRVEGWERDAPAVVELVVLTAARRGYENPRGINQETLGSHTVGLSESTGVYLTAREVAQVRRAASGRRTGYVGSVRTPSAYEEDGLPTVAYIRDNRGGEHIPFVELGDIPH